MTLGEMTKSFERDQRPGWLKRWKNALDIFARFFFGNRIDKNIKKYVHM